MADHHRISMDPRTADMVRRRRAGHTLQEIGDEYGLSRERVRQITSPLISNEEVKSFRDAELGEEVESRREDILRMAREGYSIPEIAQEFELAKWRVARIIRQDKIAMGIVLRRGQKNLKRRRENYQIERDMRHAARILGITPSRKAYRRLWKAHRLPVGAISVEAIGIRYGTWTKACAEAGLEPHGLRREYVKTFSDEDIFRALDEWEREFGEWPSCAEWEKSKRTPSEPTIRNRFGGAWTDALLAAEAFQKGEGGGS